MSRRVGSPSKGGDKAKAHLLRRESSIRFHPGSLTHEYLEATPHRDSGGPTVNV